MSSIPNTIEDSPCRRTDVNLLRLKALPKTRCGSLEKECQLSEHDFAASKAADHDVVGDEIENNSANLQTLVVENQHTNPPEEPEHMANADYDALKKPVSVFLISNHCLKQHNVRKKSKKVSSSIVTSTPIKEILEQRKKQKEEQET
ncbi:uncharacterized protein TNCV_5104581 [Trichonephila clavipes]|nr:uncharacterized protein TNCV_5104581 [Trichonephila clavipes]